MIYFVLALFSGDQFCTKGINLVTYFQHTPLSDNLHCKPWSKSIKKKRMYREDHQMVQINRISHKRRCVYSHQTEIRVQQLSTEKGECTDVNKLKPENRIIQRIYDDEQNMLKRVSCKAASIELPFMYINFLCWIINNPSYTPGPLLWTFSLQTASTPYHFIHLANFMSSYVHKVSSGDLLYISIW